ncbi:MAG: twin-arginine translocase subunit TatC [Acidaminobacter sp.]|uniref:twin-arginine translocase subunit TatC n=1 Tax=Acidaminobacter sp. TaxID=1872102 RepID=UPI0013835A3E|nr:twin-arginine translocase subunit TatC [Acidaminobacter sp.]MZQ96708.1 twin-arginine translocase subunit TatC [Acidaminobacter sp.]
MPANKTTTLISHLNELRKRLVVSAICFVAAMSVCLARSEFVIKHLVGKAKDFEFIYVAPAELLIAYIRIAIICGVVVAFPVIGFQTWQFIRPGLTRRERTAAAFVMTFGMALFLLGGVFAYEVVLPFTLKYFAGLNGGNFGDGQTIQAMVSIQNYLNFVVNTILTFGLVFEMPIVIILLTQLGILNPRLLRKNRKYVILAVFIIAAVITPPDVTSQILIAVPMLVLFEISTWISSVMFRRKLALREAS